jgi:hypothetical protein
MPVDISQLKRNLPLLASKRRLTVESHAILGCGRSHAQLDIPLLTENVGILAPISLC